MTRFLLTAAVLLPALVILLGTPGGARADATIESMEIANGYPADITFNLSASAPVEITAVTLQYAVEGRGTSAIGHPDPEAFTPGTSVETSVRVRTDPDGSSWIPVGNEIRWYWEIELADGTTTTGPEDTYLYLPNDREWHSVENDIARAYYFGPREDTANDFLAAMEVTYEEHGRQLLQTELERTPVKLVLFGNSDDLRTAVPGKGETFENSTVVVTCGVRPGSTNDLIYSALSCGGSPTDTVRHEFAHILNAAAGEGSLVRLPFWVDEGLAVYSQDEARDYTSAFESALRQDELIPFAQMSTATANQRLTILQYGQSFMMVSYLIENFGQEKLNEFLAATKANTPVDRALDEVYGLTMPQFEADFLAAQGVEPSPTPTEPAATPTTDQGGAQTPAPTPAAPRTGGSDDGIDRTVVAVGGVILICLLLAVFSLLLVLFLQNQRSGGSSA